MEIESIFGGLKFDFLHRWTAVAAFVACGLFSTRLNPCPENPVSIINNVHLGLPGGGWIGKSGPFTRVSYHVVGPIDDESTPYLEILIQNKDRPFQLPFLEFNYEDPCLNEVDDPCFVKSNIRLQFRESFSKDSEWKDYYAEECKRRSGPFFYEGSVRFDLTELQKPDSKYPKQMFFRLVEYKDGKINPIEFKLITPEIRKKWQLRE